MCRHLLRKTIWRGPWPRCCTIILLCVWFSPMPHVRSGNRILWEDHWAMCSLLGVEKIRTTPYHPQTNRAAERVYQTLQCMIGKLKSEKRRKWPANIGSIIIAYNSTRSLVTGYSPYYLMFGQRPWLPIDLLFPMHQMQMFICTIDEYVASLYDYLWESLAITQDCAAKEAQRQKWL